MSEKLHKVLAALGVGSRRDMEEYIKSGRVSVDGKVATLGDRVGEHEIIRLDGRIIRNAQSEKPLCRVLVYNKPEGQMCTTNDPQGRPTVFDRLPKIAQGRWLYVGRLDVNTSGLLLFTTDGELANGLMHPSHEVDRVYAVRVFGEVTKEAIKQLETNVELDDGPAHFDKVVYVGGEGMNQWYNVVLKEGRKREVRRLWEHLGFKVSRLKRIKYGSVELGKLPLGGYEELTLEEVNKLRALAGLKPERRTMVKSDSTPTTTREAFIKNRQIRKTVQKFAKNGRLDAKNRTKRPNSSGQSNSTGFKSMYTHELDLSNFTSLYADMTPVKNRRPARGQDNNRYVPLNSTQRDGFGENRFSKKKNSSNNFSKRRSSDEYSQGNSEGNFGRKKFASDGFGKSKPQRNSWGEKTFSEGKPSFSRGKRFSKGTSSYKTRSYND